MMETKTRLYFIFFLDTFEKEWEEVYTCFNPPPPFIKSYNNYGLLPVVAVALKKNLNARFVHNAFSVWKCSQL